MSINTRVLAVELKFRLVFSKSVAVCEHAQTSKDVAQMESLPLQARA